MTGLGRILASVPFLAVATFGCGNVGDAPEAETGEKVSVNQAGGTEYVIDSTASSIDWVGAKVTRSHDGGFTSFTGTATVDGSTLRKISVTVRTGSIWSDTEKLTKHLKSDAFFNVATIPTATFEASSFEPLDDSTGATHRVVGNLTMLNVTRSISFPATVSVSDDGVEFTADFIINRQNWGMSYPGAPDNLISDDVRLKIDAIAREEA
jgi:polyisoprenoid-binding protein YceI